LFSLFSIFARKHLKTRHVHHLFRMFQDVSEDRKAVSMVSKILSVIHDLCQRYDQSAINAWVELDGISGHINLNGERLPSFANGFSFCCWIQVFEVSRYSRLCVFSLKDCNALLQCSAYVS